MADEADASRGKEILSAAVIRHALGAGSNGAVLLATFPDPRAPGLATAKPGSIPADGRKVAIKLMSHFWDPNAKMLLDCERRTLAHLPRHPGVVQVYDQFVATIPECFSEYVTSDMRSGAAADPGHSTQAFLFAYHPMTLDAYRSVLPLPLPWPLLWRVARDLVAVVAHMESHNTAHLDLKLDNILVGYDGRCLLTDFGISRVFDSDSPPLTLSYAEPFDLLMNRLVLAPEVLIAYDRAREAVKAAAAASGAKAGPAAASASPAGDEPAPAPPASSGGTSISFGWQGVWSVGVVLYEIAAGFGHEPGYPEDGSGGMRGPYHYSTVGIPPLLARARGAVSGGADTSQQQQHGVGRSALQLTRGGALSHTLAISDDEGEPPVSAEELALAAKSGGAVSPATLAAVSTSLPPHAGYPAAFCGLVSSMLDSDPLRRVSARDALLLLDALAPRYQLASGSPELPSVAGGGGGTKAPPTRPPGAPVDGCFPVRLPCGGVVQVPTEQGVLYFGEEGAYLAEADPEDNSGYTPVLLRHLPGGACRLLRCHDGMPLDSILEFWAAGAAVEIVLPVVNDAAGAATDATAASGHGGKPARTEPYSSDPGPADDTAVKACRLFLGGCELLNRSASLEAVVRYLLQDDVTAPLYAFPQAEPRHVDGKRVYKHAIRPAVVLDLAPREPDAVSASAGFLLGQLREVCRVSSNAPALSVGAQSIGKGAGAVATGSRAPRPLLISSDAALLPPPPPLLAQAGSGQGASKRRKLDAASSFAPLSGDESAARTAELLAWLASYGGLPSDSHSDSDSAGSDDRPALALVARPSTPYGIDMREAVLHRCLLGLTSVCNEALKDPDIDFPYTQAAAFAVTGILEYPSRHDTASAGIGLLRNVSCTEKPPVAIALASIGCVDAVVSGFFSPWTQPTSKADGRGRVAAASTPDAAAAMALAYAAVGLPAPTVSAGSGIHGDDPRVAEDAVLAASNLMRFDEVQTPAIDLRRAAALAVAGMLTHPSAQTLHDSGARLLRYLLAIRPGDGSGAAGAATALASVGALHALIPGLTAFAGDRAMTELLLHVTCSILVFEEARAPHLCPYRSCAVAVVALMTRPEYADDEAILGLGATVLRNLACVPVQPSGTAAAVSGGAGAEPTSTSTAANVDLTPALVVTQAGAAAALEGAMERHPSSATIQENGRCALYNLLLIAANDASGIVAEAQRLASEVGCLRRQLLEASSHREAGVPPPAAGRPRAGTAAKIAAAAAALTAAAGDALSPSAAAPVTASLSDAAAAAADADPDALRSHEVVAAEGRIAYDGDYGERLDDAWSPDTTMVQDDGDGDGAANSACDDPLVAAAPTASLPEAPASLAAEAGDVSIILASQQPKAPPPVVVGPCDIEDGVSPEPAQAPLFVGHHSAAVAVGAGPSQRGDPSVSAAASRRRYLLSIVLLLVLLLGAVGAAIAGFLT